MSDSVKLLSDIHVIEAASVIMAPAAGTILADFGADVIKVESHVCLKVTRKSRKLPNSMRIIR